MNFTKRKIFTKFTKFLLKMKLVGKVAFTNGIHY